MPNGNRNKRKRHVFRTWVQGQKTPIVTPVLCSPATTSVDTTITELDVRSGAPGISVACAIHHVCAQENPFPHPAYHIEVSRTRVAVVDKINKRTGQWTHCVVYGHNKAAWTKEFDRPGGKAQLLKQWTGDVSVTLSPPPKDAYRPGRARGKNDGSRSPVSPVISRTAKGGKNGPARRWCEATGPLFA